MPAAAGGELPEPPGDASVSPRPARDSAIRGLFILAIIWAIDLAQDILLPLTIAMLLTFLLRPLARSLARLGVPKALAAALLLLGLIGVVGQVSYVLIGPTSEWIGEFPSKIRTVERRFRELRKPVEKVTEAAARVEALAGVPSGQANQKVEVVNKQAGLASMLVSGTGTVLASLLLIFALTFFLLASGDAFFVRLVRLLPLAANRQSVEVLFDIERHASRYVLIITSINVALGVAVGAGLFAIGLPNVVLWGTVACVLNFVPYLGAMVGVAVVSVAGLVAFDDLGRVFACAGLYLLLTFIEGTVITPMILGRRLTLSPLVVFLALLFWGALWGIPGALIAVPLLAVFKLVCDEIPSLRGLSELLGAGNGNPILAEEP